MSMVGNYKQISPAALEVLQEDPTTIEGVIYAEHDSADGTTLYLDKAWQGIHFILTGTTGIGDTPLFHVALGGHDIGEDLDYGPVRFLSPVEVVNATEALASITEAEFKKRFDPQAMMDNQIYPFTEKCTPEDADYLVDYFKQLKKFYSDTASHGNAMLVYIN